MHPSSPNAQLHTHTHTSPPPPPSPQYDGEDFEADCAALDAEPRNKEWHELCDPMQVHPAGEGAGGSASGGSAWQVLEQVFFNA